MEENIVGFTLIFSLLLWIPPAIVLHFCVSYVSARVRERERERVRHNFSSQYDKQVWKNFKKENTDFIHALRSGHLDTSEEKVSWSRDLMTTPTSCVIFLSPLSL